MAAKNGNEKEIERLLSIIEKLSRLDAKVVAFCEQYKLDNNELRKLYEQALVLISKNESTIRMLDERDNKVNIEIVKLKSKFDRWKMMWAAVAFIVSPIITTIIVLFLQKYVSLVLP